VVSIKHNKRRTYTKRTMKTGKKIHSRKNEYQPIILQIASAFPPAAPAQTARRAPARSASTGPDIGQGIVLVNKYKLYI
jgi:hypothetical protein